MFDTDLSRMQEAFRWFREDIEKDVADGFLSDDEAQKQLTNVNPCLELTEAVQNACYIQESGPEDLNAKQTIYRALETESPPTAIIGSSTSGLDIEPAVRELETAGRYLTAHPCNPPHLIPVVELVPTGKTLQQTMEKAKSILKDAGMMPVCLNHFITDFLLNRIQSAVVQEALYLVKSGVADVEAVDAVIHSGLGLRWALLGNFGVNNTNADGGIREYYTRFGESYREGIASLKHEVPSFSESMISDIAEQVNRMEKDVPVNEICRWRDRMIRRIRQLKEEDPHPSLLVE